MSRVPTDGDSCSSAVLWIGLPPNVVTRVRRQGAVGSVFVIALGIVAWVFGSEIVKAVAFGIASLLLAVTILECAWWETARRRAFRLSVGAAVVTVARGTVFHRVDTIPLARITIVRTRVGPFSRRYGHVNVTLVATTQEIALPPLSVRRSRQLVSAIEARSRD
jgi:membrane protein YdbS with pleckstrin-like domain